ncbi:DUF1232 domain-containing protein [Mycobacterium sp.]|uniref:YkvA family protein n=1 Tax=Mycobacterium sp. TaxID=1785 RepID=UPI0025D00302|nr:DUF1232 domain-containing protein [Mycobacterium sp.]
MCRAGSGFGWCCCWCTSSCPIDVIPDFIPVLGYADDAIILAVALRSVRSKSQRPLVGERVAAV